VTPFFFDVFEWLARGNLEFDYFVNLETDMLFIRAGYERSLAQLMRGQDYMVPNLVQFLSSKSRWRPIRSLMPELRNWYRLLGFQYTHGGFSPGQVFSRNYVEKLVNHKSYGDIKKLLDANKSYSLQEVLFPTLVDFLKVRGRSYPAELKPINRYRPYQAVEGIKRALGLRNAYFVHPVRREANDRARVYVRELMTSHMRGALGTCRETT